MVNFSYKVDLTRAGVNRTYQGRKKRFHHRVRRGGHREHSEEDGGAVAVVWVVLWYFGRGILGEEHG
jgi:hypothetical protein